MTFLQLLGYYHRVAAEALSEAAAVDVVLVIDNSVSQAYDAPSMGASNNPAVIVPGGVAPRTLACDPAVDHAGLNRSVWTL